MTGAAATVDVRDLGLADLDDVVRIDAFHTDAPKREWWVGVFDDFLAGRRRKERIGLAAHRDGRLVGYLLGEVRAFEFGSEACGWVFAVGVHPEAGRDRVGSTLLAAALARFRALGIGTVRTMARRNDVPFIAFFRSNGFVGGSFVQLELDLGEEP